MARRKKSREGTLVSLFPFLSVLVCTIGSLVLVISTTSVFSIVKTEKKIVMDLVGQSQGTMKKPVFIECRKDRLIVQPENVSVLLDEVRQGDSAFQQVLSEIEQQKKAKYFLFAIRPDGMQTFFFLRGIVEELGLDYGYEAVNADWILQF